MAGACSTLLLHEGEQSCVKRTTTTTTSRPHLLFPRRKLFNTATFEHSLPLIVISQHRLPLINHKSESFASAVLPSSIHIVGTLIVST